MNKDINISSDDIQPIVVLINNDIDFKVVCLIIGGQVSTLKKVEDIFFCFNNVY